MAKRTGRQRSQLPNCYYEGYLEKRSFKDKTTRKMWTCLCGNALFFFNEKRDADYIEKLDLSGLISITDDGSMDRNLDAARLNLQMKDENIKFNAPNAEARELWKGFIHSVTELSVPSSLNLLPGQIHMLKETVQREKERINNVTPPAVTNIDPYVTLHADMPACFYSMSRLEAELLLEREAKRGNLLLRPGSTANSFAITTRQEFAGSIFKHYRVTRKHNGGFIIDVDTPVPCTTLHDVINYLVEKTDRVLIPLILEEAYEKNISFIRSDNENGEKTVQDARADLLPPCVPPKPVSLRLHNPEPALEAAMEESLYLNDMPKEPVQEKEDSSAVPLPPQPDMKASKKAIIPPTPPPRKLAPAALLSLPVPSAHSRKLRAQSDPLEQTISELKLKLEKQARCVE